MHLIIRKARPDELEQILAIYRSARAFMKQTGNPDQWGDTYPEEATIREDIRTGRCHVLAEDDTCERVEKPRVSADPRENMTAVSEKSRNCRPEGIIPAVFALCPGEDPDYRRIDGGQWLNDRPYVAVHRVASDGTVHGVVRLITDWCKQLSDDLRIDTYKDNKIMQRSVEKCGFVRCGTIYVRGDSPRIAYHWTRGE